MSNARRITALNGRPISAEPTEPERPPVCPDGRMCPHACTVRCLHVESGPPEPDLFPDDRWPTPIVADPAPVVNIDGVLVPPAFADHNRLEWKAETVDGIGQGPIRASAKTGRGWYRCGCGWGSGPLDPNDLARRAPIPQGDAWVEWTDHLPAGFLAFRDALVQWRDDHPGLTMPPIGWDGVERYAWRSWGTPRIDDAGKIVVPRKPDPEPPAEVVG